MTSRPFHDAAIVLTIAFCIAVLFAAIDKQKQPKIDTAELTGWFKLEGRN